MAKSAEVSTALIVLTAFLGLNILGPYLAGQLKETVHYFLENMALWQGDAAGFKALFLTALIRLALIVLPILLMFMLAGGRSARYCRLVFSIGRGPKADLLPD